MQVLVQRGAAVRAANGGLPASLRCECKRSALPTLGRSCRAPCRSEERPNRAVQCPLQIPPQCRARWPARRSTQPAWPAAGRLPAAARGGRGPRCRRACEAAARLAVYGARQARLRSAALRAARSTLARGPGPASHAHRIRSCWQKPKRNMPYPPLGSHTPASKVKARAWDILLALLAKDSRAVKNTGINFCLRL